MKSYCLLYIMYATKAVSLSWSTVGQLYKYSSVENFSCGSQTFINLERAFECAIFGRPYYRSSLWYSVSSVVCLSSSVCDVLYCDKMVLPSQKVSEGVNRKPGSKSSFFGRRHISTSGFGSTASETAVSCLMYCGEMVRPSKKLSEGVNRKPGSKSSFLGSPPYFYFRFHRYGHQVGRFWLIFARTAQQSVLDGTNGVSSSKPCAYCRIVRSELKPDSVLFVFIT